MKCQLQGGCPVDRHGELAHKLALRGAGPAIGRGAAWDRRGGNARGRSCGRGEPTRNAAQCGLVRASARRVNPMRYHRPTAEAFVSRFPPEFRPCNAC